MNFFAQFDVSNTSVLTVNHSSRTGWHILLEHWSMEAYPCAKGPVHMTCVLVKVFWHNTNTIAILMTQSLGTNNHLLKEPCAHHIVPNMKWYHTSALTTLQPQQKSKVTLHERQLVPACTANL